MKLLYLIALLFVSCQNQPHSVKKILSPVNESKLNEQTFHFSNEDTVVLPISSIDTFRYSKEDFKRYSKLFCKLFEDYVRSPEELYFKDQVKQEFNSEAGQDNFYVLYSYFLSKRITHNYTTVRNNLISLYTNINSLFQNLEHGGTYFGHQGYRILGYAEYFIYNFSMQNNKPRKTYSIKRQKQLYVQSLRQLVKDENSIDFEVLGEQKEKQIKRENEIVDKIDKLITNVFFLRMAQEFQFEYYSYY